MSRSGEKDRTLNGTVRIDSVQEATRRLLSTDEKVRPVRVDILIAIPEKFHAELGLRTTIVDRIERRIHGLLWRAIPRSVAGRFAPAYFAYRRRTGAGN